MDNESEKPLDPKRLATQVDLWSYESYADDEPSENPPTLAPLLSARDVVEAVMIALNDEAKATRHSRILVLGVVDQGEVIERLLRLGAQVSYHDPAVARIDLLDGETLESVAVSDDLLHSLDCLLIMRNDDVFDWQRIANETRLVVDCLSALHGIKGRARVVTL